jgi:hypothetical protein
LFGVISMNKFVAVAGAACALAATAAHAGPFDGAYGNTVTQTMADGATTVIYVNADGTWQQMRNGKTAKGTYTWKDATTACFVQTDPAPTPDQQKAMGDGCQNFAGPVHVVGDSWTEKGPGGQSITMKITAGRS